MPYCVVTADHLHLLEAFLRSEVIEKRQKGRRKRGKKESWYL